MICRRVCVLVGLVCAATAFDASSRHRVRSLKKVASQQTCAAPEQQNPRRGVRCFSEPPEAVAEKAPEEEEKKPSSLEDDLLDAIGTPAASPEAVLSVAAPPTRNAAPGAVPTSAAPAGGPPPSMAAGPDGELAQRIITCGNCKAVYPLSEDALGSGPGMRVRCEVCGNVWFQSNSRVNRLFDSFVLESYPEGRKENFATERESPRAKPERRVKGAVTLFVANIPFRHNDAELAGLFDGIAEVASATVITDDTGRSRGFGFVDLVVKDAADKAVERLHGADIQGRELIVRIGHRRGSGPAQEQRR